VFACLDFRVVRPVHAGELSQSFLRQPSRCSQLPKAAAERRAA
jgi:hypothetical protein